MATGTGRKGQESEAIRPTPSPGGSSPWSSPASGRVTRSECAACRPRLLQPEPTEHAGYDALVALFDVLRRNRIEDSQLFREGKERLLVILLLLGKLVVLGPRVHL